MHDSPATSPALSRARARIARIDGSIVRLIADRVAAARLAATAKRDASLPLFDPGQEARVVRRAAELARVEGLPEEDVRILFWQLIALTRESEAQSS